jgi:hypothetical protein
VKERQNAGASDDGTFKRNEMTLAGVFLQMAKMLKEYKDLK